jgi:eukaryotic-like serine/threonine-protein kinase
MQPEVIGGRYRVVRAVGQGGMGTVWLCRDETLRRDVAVKQVGLLPGESVTDSARALREARSSAALSHRNVVTVFDVVEERRAIWLVMEHVPSRSLADLIRQEGPLDVARVADIGAQVADGLAAAHAAGMMHRDVKPGNILVRDDGLAKVSDFGIARSAGDPALTQSGLLTGTPSYFSPELARGAAPTPASDVWALGATLYAAVQGRPPYRPRENPVAVLHDIATQQPPAPDRAGYLEPVLLRTLDRDPASRWSMADAAHALNRLARDHPLESTRVQTLAATAPVSGPVSAPASGAASDRGSGPRSGPARTSSRRPAPVPDRRARDATARPVRLGPERSRRRRGGYAVLAALALLLVVGGLAFVLTHNAPGRSPSASDQQSTSAGGSSSGSPSARAGGSATTSSSRSQTKAAFVRGYFAAAPGGTDRAWAQLGPGEQAQGRGSYDGFWRTIASVDVRDIQPATGADSVDLTLTYHKTDGESSTERHRLDLVRSRDGGYLIDDDTVIR